MREDFHMVIIERPRWGSRLPNRKTGISLWRYDPDYEFPQDGGSRFRWKMPTKSFTDRLGPLDRFLRHRLRRPWHKVEGEIRQALDLRTLIGRHLWDHLLAMVERNCRIVDRRPVRLDGRPVRRFYVHPTSGLLLEPKPVREDKTAERNKRIEEATDVVLDDGTLAKKIEGLWYLGEPRVEDVAVTRRNWDGRPVVVLERRTLVPRKQANRAEIRRILEALRTSSAR